MLNARVSLSMSTFETNLVFVWIVLYNYIIFSLISKSIFSTILQDNTFLPHYEMLSLFQRCLQGSRQGDVTRPAYNSVHFTFTSKNLPLTFTFTFNSYFTFTSTFTFTFNVEVFGHVWKLVIYFLADVCPDTWVFWSCLPSDISKVIRKPDRHKRTTHILKVWWSGACKISKMAIDSPYFCLNCLIYCYWSPS